MLQVKEKRERDRASEKMSVDEKRINAEFILKTLKETEGVNVKESYRFGKGKSIKPSRV